MKQYYIIITSKNKQSLNNFFKLFLNNNGGLNFNGIKKFFQITEKREVITILKSPHVNKKAQEQFEYQIFSKKLNIYSAKNLQLLLFLKKIKLNLFNDVNIKIKLTVTKKLQKKTRTNVFNPSNFSLSSFKNIKTYNLKKKDLIFLNQTSQILKLLDIYGELIKM